MNTTQNINLIKKLFDEIYNRGNLSSMDQFFTKDVILNDPAVANFKRNLKALRDKEAQYLKAFPDRRLHIDELLATEDRVIVIWTCEGTHTGELQGLSPTDKAIHITGISIYRFTNGLISEITQSWDRLGLLEQIGEVDPAFVLHR